MGPEKWKGELPVDEAGERDREGSGRTEEESQPGAAREATDPREDIDPREEEGWSQPESSAQKEPEQGPTER